MNHKIIFGDCLEVMKKMDEKSIDLIVTDPPYCTGNDFVAYNDSWDWDEKTVKEYHDIIAKNHDVFSFILLVNQMHNQKNIHLSAYLTFIASRLIEMKRLLKDDGSIYMQCDTKANSYIRILMDMIFDNNLRNEIAWCYFGPGSGSAHFPKKHDTIYFYTKSNKYTFNKDAVRIPYKKEVSCALGFSKNAKKPIEKEKLIEMNKKGKLPEDYWIDINPIPQVPKEEKTGYPTQKPIALVSRMILASSNIGDTVLDPFCGSGTTIKAAQQLNRHGIGIDLNKKSPAPGRLQGQEALAI